MFELKPASTDCELAAARALLREYERSLGVDLAYQNFDDELAGLPGDYALPHGRLLLAWHDGAPAGCVALRPRSATVCEMKRLFVRPAFRGLHLGHLLATAAIAAARQIGYATICLDTLPFMRDAQRLYAGLGFVPCAPYYATPIEGVVFLELKLSPAHTADGGCATDRLSVPGPSAA